MQIGKQKITGRGMEGGKSYSSLAPFAKAHLRCFPLLRSSFLLIKWRSLRGFLCTDSHASMESAHKKPRVNCNSIFSIPFFLSLLYAKNILFIS